MSEATVTTATTKVTTTTQSTTTTLKLITAGDLLKDNVVSTNSTTLLSLEFIETPVMVPWILLDDDGDGVLNGVDKCPDTPEGMDVDEDGCGCKDSDGGVKAYVFGRVKQTKDPQENFLLKGESETLQLSVVNPGLSAIAVSDICVDDSTVREYFCNESQRRDSVLINCPAGCSGGRCVCNDGDGGLNYTVRGTFTVRIGGSSGGSQQPSSGGGYMSADGQHLMLQGTHYVTQIQSTAAEVLADIGLPMSDYCVSDTVLREFYCDENGSIVYTDYVCPDICEHGRCVTVPNVNLLFVPIRWNGNQDDFEESVDTQIRFFIDAIPLRECPDEVSIETLDLSDEMDAGFDCSTASVRNHVTGLGLNAADYDVIVGLTNVRPCGNVVGRSNGVDTIWVFNGYDIVGAHELGHIYGLEDEYCSNPAGSTDGRCNDGGPAFGGLDVNYLDAGGIQDCPPQGTEDSTGNRCCNFYDSINNRWKNCSVVNYGICCLGNKLSSGGRAIMSFADVDLFSPGPRAFDVYSQAHLSSFPQLNCGNPYRVYTFPWITVFPLESSDSGVLGESGLNGYEQNISSGKVVYLNLDFGIDGGVTEREATLRDGRPTMSLADEGSYHLMTVDEDGKPLWEGFFELYFDYRGPREYGVDYSGENQDVLDFSVKIPYFPKMKEVRVYHEGKQVYSRALDFCVVDGVCGVTETAETCPQDCKPGMIDKVCDPRADGVCDPDCLWGVDPDCEITEETTCYPALLGLAVFLVSLTVLHPINIIF